MEKLRVYSISDRYIQYLRNDLRLRNVYDNKLNQRRHTRKYLGIVFVQSGFNYFVPFSSPKSADYRIDETGSQVIRKSIVPIIRMVSCDSVTGVPELKGTLKLSNMIPVPETELTPYRIGEEQNPAYKIIVEKEYKFIKQNAAFIIKNATVLYRQKIHGDSLFGKGKAPDYLRQVIDFQYAEGKCREFRVEDGDHDC